MYFDIYEYEIINFSLNFDSVQKINKKEKFVNILLLHISLSSVI